jgi:phage shock protein A
MSIMKRMSMIFRSKANSALDRAEDPRETLDYSYQKQLEMLQKVVAVSPTSPPAASASSCRPTSCSSRATSCRARRSRRSGAGREDLAREALTRRARTQTQIGELQAQHASCRARRRS